MNIIANFKNEYIILFFYDFYKLFKFQEIFKIMYSFYLVTLLLGYFVTWLLCYLFFIIQFI
jgi:hypothetical protein